MMHFVKYTGGLIYEPTCRQVQYASQHNEWNLLLCFIFNVITYRCDIILKLLLMLIKNKENTKTYDISADRYKLW